tara:strand:- start:349 stop:588 length:240 start_codon:yes stop_codon:yes gene_type:complete
MKNLTASQKTDLIEQYIELYIDNMGQKDLETFVKNTLIDELIVLSEKDLKDEIKYTYDKDLLDELIDNVTTPTTTKGID